MKKLTLLFFSIFFLISCNEAKKEASPENQKEKKEDIVANYKSVEVDIEGMTCEIGCARTIESKLSKVDGISYSKVSFEDKKGQFTYDANKLSKDDIANKIGEIAGGDLYSVTKTVEIDKIFKKTE
ncbi:heavy-metal-associated domain-containing protein [Lutibacter sp. B1]|uniref:heavy-metal-associated domain-containing protein n=1 Tax=Lutibacter sp. B1 TaxID=2725996 RepID=UPI001456E5BB|nr:heavy metal-associated domain-containing protein [Lutibacter sp. B1]NLP57819.1 heavy-metal-associated domain-containing protein [Lutibacter sp. B1]